MMPEVSGALNVLLVLLGVGYLIAAASLPATYHLTPTEARNP